MGLGLCRSAPWVKRLHFGHIPDWYHHGGPFQVGGNLAVQPNCLVDAAICFLQPDLPPRENLTLCHARGTVTSLWRQSQFVPAVDAPRGPPSHTHESVVA